MGLIPFDAPRRGASYAAAPCRRGPLAREKLTGFFFTIQNLFSENTFWHQKPRGRVLDPIWLAGHLGGGQPPVGRCSPRWGLGRGPRAGTG